MNVLAIIGIVVAVVIVIFTVLTFIGAKQIGDLLEEALR